MMLRKAAIMFSFLLLVGARFALAQQNEKEPTLTGMTVLFHTTDDDKDWDTQVGTEVVCNAHDVARLQCRPPQ